MPVVSFNKNFLQPGSKRREFLAFEDIKRYAVVETMLASFMRHMEPLNEERDSPLFIAAIRNTDSHAILVTTIDAYRSRAQEVQNVKSKLRAKHGFAEVEEAIAPQGIVRDYLLHANKIHKEGSSDLERQDSEANNIALQELHELVKSALIAGASDIHIVLSETDAQIRFRVDGTLTQPLFRERGAIAPMIAAALNAKSDDFKSIYNEHEINANTIDVPEIEYNDPDTGEKVTRMIRLRVQKTPSQGGFRVTARIQDTGVQKAIRLEDIDLDKDVKAILTHAFSQSIGIILFSGPVGQGKTTTLVACNDIPIKQNKKIISLEDPIEIIQPGIQQTKCIAGHPELNFPNMIKIALREDMDVLEVSEIRDYETAVAGMRGAVTGHLIVSTIHANSAVGIVPRLLELGVTSKQLSQPNVLRVLTGQRLVQKLCPECKVMTHFDPTTIPYTYKGEFYYRANNDGCNNCKGKGIIGRQLIMEALVIDKRGRDYIAAEDFDGWTDYLENQGYQTMAMRAWKYVERGVVDPHLVSESVPEMWSRADDAFDYTTLLEESEK